MKKVNKILSELFYGKPALGEKMQGLGQLRIKKTTVPKTFMDNFKWDSHLFENIIIIENK